MTFLTYHEYRQKLWLHIINIINYLRKMFNFSTLLGIALLVCFVWFSLKFSRVDQQSNPKNMHIYIKLLFLGLGAISLFSSKIFLSHGLFSNYYAASFHEARSAAMLAEKDENINETNSIFLFTIYIIIFCIVAILASLGVAWFFYLTGLLGAWILIVLCTIVNFIIMGRNGWLFHVLYLSIAALFISSNNEYGAAMLIVSVMTLYLFYLLWINILKYSKYTAGFKRWLIIEPIRNIREISLIYYDRLYGGNSMKEYQATVIGASIMFFIIGPFAVKYFPPIFSETVKTYLNTMEESYDYVAYGAFCLYFIMSASPIIKHFHGNHTRNNVRILEDTKSDISSLLSLILVALIVLIVFGFPDLFIATSIVKIGHEYIGKKFALIIGFFVFPLWIPKINCLIISIIKMSFSHQRTQ